MNLTPEYNRIDHREQEGILRQAMGVAAKWPHNSCVRMTLATLISEWAAHEVQNTWLQAAQRLPGVSQEPPGFLVVSQETPWRGGVSQETLAGRTLAEATHAMAEVVQLGLDPPAPGWHNKKRFPELGSGTLPAKDARAVVNACAGHSAVADQDDDPGDWLLDNQLDKWAALGELGPPVFHARLSHGSARR
jgi:hypothetical protein